MHRYRWTVWVCMSLWLVCATPALAQPDLSRTIGSTVADRASASYAFSALQLTAADGQRRYRIRIAVPKRHRRRPVIRWCICWMATRH